MAPLKPPLEAANPAPRIPIPPEEANAEILEGKRPNVRRKWKKRKVM